MVLMVSELKECRLATFWIFVLNLDYGVEIVTCCSLGSCCLNLEVVVQLYLFRCFVLKLIVLVFHDCCFLFSHQNIPN